MRSPAKLLARLTGRTPKAVQRWLDADNEPNIESLIALCREFDAVWDEFRAMCGRDPGTDETTLDQIAAMLRERRRER